MALPEISLVLLRIRKSVVRPRLLTASLLIAALGSTVIAQGPNTFFAQGDSLGGYSIQGNPEADDRFGAVLALGDFNGDGVQDIAIGVPDEAVKSNSVSEGGAVNVVYGRKTGLSGLGNQIWSLDQPALANAAHSGDHFGAALAAGDFDHDGRDDLAIGVPGYNTDAGAVAILYGSGAGLSSSRFQLYWQGAADYSGGPKIQGTSTSWSLFGGAGDAFGSALAAGDLDGNGVDDLVVGIPFERSYTGNGAKDGAVGVIYGSWGSGLTADGNQLFLTALGGSEFGHALAIGDFDRDSRQDLAVGMPGLIPYGTLTNEAGGIAAISGAAFTRIIGTYAADSLPGYTVITQGSSGVPGSIEANDHFGSSLASADFNRDGYDDLAVGVPDEDIGDKSDAGNVNVLYGGAVGLSGSGAQSWNLDTDLIKGVAADDDRFGAALAAGDFNHDGYPDLAIGIPGRASSSGAMTILYSTASGVTDWDEYWDQDSPGVPGGPEADDEFGAALVAGDFYGRGFDGLVIGVPGENGSGAVSTLYGFTEAPSAVSASVITNEDTPLTFTLVGQDAQGDALTFHVTTSCPGVCAPGQMANGFLSGPQKLDGSTAQVTYTPSSNWSGDDSFTFTVSDGVNTSLAATVTIHVRAVNDPPVAYPAYVTGPEDAPLYFRLSASDIDTPSSQLRFRLSVWPTHGQVATDQNGYVTATDCPDGGWSNCTVYTPDADFNGADQFSFTVTDGFNVSAAVFAYLTISPVNDAPVAISQSVTPLEDSRYTIVLKGTDVDGDALTYQTLTQPDHGTLGPVYTANCSLIGYLPCPAVDYTPTPNYFWTWLDPPDSFIFSVSDGQLTSRGSVTLRVQPVNDPPVLAPQSFTVVENQTLQFVLHATDIDSPQYAMSFAVESQPNVGQLTLQSNGTGSFNSGSGNWGSVTFQVRVSDGQASTLQTFAITVTHWLQCDPGSYAANPTTDLTCTPAPPGSYVDQPGQTSATLCKAGTYSDQPGAVECLPANPGSYVAGPGATSDTLCAAGSYTAAQGVTTCTLAPPGTYVREPGAYAPIDCAAGSFSDVEGATRCTLAPPGRFVPGPAAVSALRCDVGTYSADFGAVQCTPAPPGMYVSDLGADHASACSAGFYQPLEGQASCLPGSACPVGSAAVTPASGTTDTVCAADTDGDGIPDALDLDDDNDGVSDTTELAVGSNPLVADTDGDGWSDLKELTCKSDPKLAASVPVDNDHDGIINCDDPDDDDDGILDVNDPDIDGDGIANEIDADPESRLNTHFIGGHGTATVCTAWNTIGYFSTVTGQMEYRQACSSWGIGDVSLDGEVTSGAGTKLLRMFNSGGYDGIPSRTEVIVDPNSTDRLTVLACGRFVVDSDAGNYSFFCGSLHLTATEGTVRARLDADGAAFVTIANGASAVVDVTGTANGLTTYHVTAASGPGTVAVTTSAGTQSVAGDQGVDVTVASPGDQDDDGVLDTVDNCRVTPNRDQADLDGDGIGDACDADANGDGVEDAGAADSDHDGVVDAADNCRFAPNPDQADSDGDGIGDRCDGDSNVTPPPSVPEGCPVDAATGLPRDTDHDGTPDCLDPDADNDGLSNVDELAAGLNPFSADSDGDGAPDGADRWPLDPTKSFDILAPVITVPGALDVPAESPAGAVVVYGPTTAVDDIDGPVPVACAPLSGTTFAMGATTVRCTSTDATGNTATATFTVTVNDVTTPGEMRGDGTIKVGEDRYQFAFDVRERASDGERGRFSLKVKYKDVSEKGKKTAKKEPRGDDRFQSTSVTFVAFSDDPTIRPGKARRPQVDTVRFSGIGEWNGRAGYTVEVLAADEGEPGRHRESLTLVIRDANGAVVAQAAGALADGNVRSSRIAHGQGRERK